MGGVSVGKGDKGGVGRGGGGVGVRSMVELPEC